MRKGKKKTNNKDLCGVVGPWWNRGVCGPVDGVAEVHPDPSVALSDAGQQMDLDEFQAFYDELKPLADLYNAKKLK